jgi:choline dehydrogenase-like flavoprotein
MAISKTPTEVIDAGIVVVGAGLVGGITSWDLSLKGLNVAMIDSGPLVERYKAVKRFKESPVKDNNAPYVTAPYAPSPDEENPWDYYVQKNHDSKKPLKQVGFTGLYIRNVGGTSWHFTGHAERMYPNDFCMKTAYGRGKDWPISYNDLVPYYERVEKAWGVAGNRTCISPEPIDFPLPYIPLTYLDEQVNTAAEQLGDSIGPLPQCRNSVPYDDRPQCCGNASCVFICPIGAKYDGSVHVGKAQTAGARLYHSHVVYDIIVDDDQSIKEIHYTNFQDPDNPVNGVARAKIFILAAHGIETPRLLLLSKGENAPNGVANSSDQVGRNLMSMGGVDARAYVPKPVYPLRGPVNATGAFRGLRDGDFRKDFACIEAIVINGGFDATTGPLTEAEDAIKAGRLGKKLRDRVHANTVRQVYIDNAVEMLPQEHNRVTLAKERTKVMELPRPEINFRFDEYTMEGIYQSWTRSIKVLDLMGGKIPGGMPKPNRREFAKLVAGKLDPKYNDLAAGAALISGTCRMGDDPKTSVVDKWCRSHDHKNLFIIGTCNYVTSGVVSPSETAAALGLRAADHIAATFNRMGG